MNELGLVVNIGFCNNPTLNERTIRSIVGVLVAHVGDSPRQVFVTVEAKSAAKDDLVERRMAWGKDRSAVLNSILKEIQGHWPAKCVRIDAMVSKKAGPQSRAWMFDISCKWEANDDHAMPGYATLYLSEQVIHSIANWRLLLTDFISAIESIGVIATGIGTIEDASDCYHGDVYCSSAPGESQAIRFASRRLWADDILAGNLRVYQPAWCMILGSTVCGPSLRAELEAWAANPGRLEGEREWFQLTSGGAAIITIGPRPIESVTDIFESNGDALLSACRVLKRNQLI